MEGAGLWFPRSPVEGFSRYITSKPTLIVYWIPAARLVLITATSRPQDLIPDSTADKIIHYDSRCYSGQFSDDGNFFFCCSQDFKVRMYDTSNPFDWKYYKTVEYPFGQWTITDASLSPDNRYLAYSSIRHIVCLAATDPMAQLDPISLDFARARESRSRTGRHSIGSHFGVGFTLRFLTCTEHVS